MLQITMVFAVVTVSTAICLFTQSNKNQQKIKFVRSALGLSTLVLWVSYCIYYFLPLNFDWSYSLPLHVCDVSAVMAVITMLRPTRISRAVLYFTAFILTIQSFITPTGNQDPMTLRFWFYWGMHGLILICAIFDLWVLRYRPSFKDYVVSNCATLVYITVMLPVNLTFNWNYGYIGNDTPDETTAISFLGPWPERLLLLVGLIALAQLLIYLPWKFLTTSSVKPVEEGAS